MIYRPLFVRSEISRDLLVEPETRIRILGTERERQISAGTLKGGPLTRGSAPAPDEDKFDRGGPVEREPRPPVEPADQATLSHFSILPRYLAITYQSSGLFNHSDAPY